MMRVEVQPDGGTITTLDEWMNSLVSWASNQPNVKISLKHQLYYSSLLRRFALNVFDCTRDHLLNILCHLFVIHIPAIDKAMHLLQIWFHQTFLLCLILG